MFSKIIGTGSYLPKKIITNDDLAKQINTTHEWIAARTGIHARHIAGPEESASSMGTTAALRALEMANIAPNQIDLIIVATCTADLVFPSTAVLIQNQLNIKHAAAFDVSAACAGFNYAVNTADAMIRSGQSKTALVIGSETMSRLLDWKDRSTCILFGDGAGAVVLTQSETPGIISSFIAADGSYKDLLFTPQHKIENEKFEPGYLQMQGKEVFKVAVHKLGEMVDTVLTTNHLQKHDIDWLVPHQANVRIIEATAKKLDMPMTKVVLTVAEHGNTSAASIPLALDTAVRDGRIKPGQRLLLESFGGGFTWGAVLLVY